MKAVGTPESGAVFSDDMKYRYRLWRSWNPDYPRALFILLNPSTADDVRNDPTIERQQRRVMLWGNQSDLFSGQLPGRKFGSIEVVNACAYRSTDPEALQEVGDPVGHDNGEHIGAAIQETMARQTGIIVCGWGRHLLELGPHGTTYHDLLLESLEGYGFPLSALKLNSDGTPQHPLYLPYEMKPRLWFHGALWDEAV